MTACGIFLCRCEEVPSAASVRFVLKASFVSLTYWMPSCLRVVCVFVFLFESASCISSFLTIRMVDRLQMF